MQAIETGRHEYRMKGGLKIFYLFFGLILCGVGIFFAVTFAQLPKAGVAALVGVAPMAIGIYLLALALRSRLAIDGTRFEVRGAFGEKTAEIGEIEGFRTISTRNGSYWRLQLKQGRGSITIQKWFDCDDLRAWFQQLTDLDEQDRKQLLEEIEQDQELGTTPEQRLGALAAAKQWNVGLFVIAVIAAAGLFAGGVRWRLPAAMVLALVPVVALSLLNTKPLLYALGKSKRDPRNELSIALLASGMGLFFAGMQTHFVSMMPLLPLIVVVALAFIAAFYMMARKGPRTQGFHAIVLICGGFFAMGLIAASDTLLDNARPAPYAAQVVNKHTSSGRSTTYYLDFDAWGPFSGANHVSVPFSIYQTAQPGDTVCFEVYPGALHASWFERVSCDAP
jgi:MFS family permease